MNTLNNYILEKLVINNNLKPFTKVDNKDFNMIKDMIKATFIYIFKNKVYKVRGLATYSIKRSEIKYDEIANILNTEFGYHFSEESAKEFHGDFQALIRKYMTAIEQLINMKKIYLDGDNELLNGHDIYQNVWIKYREKYLR